MQSATSRQIQRSTSHTRSPLEAAQKIATDLNSDNTALAIFFASPSYNKDELADAINLTFGDTPVIGCSTAGEITPEGYKENSITGFALPADDFQCVVSCIEHVSDIDLERASIKSKQLKKELEEKTGKDCSVDDTFALLFCDGLSMREEILTAGIHQSLNSLQLVGGSAGDGTNFGETWVYHNGVAKSDRAVLVLARTTRPFKTIKTEHFTNTTSAHVVTEADPEARIVWEIDAEPAADVYARIVGVDKDKLSPEIYATHPLAVKIAGDIYVRSVQRVIEGIEPEIIIGCDCILRQLEAKNTNTFDQVSKIMQDNQVVGFSTYGEQVGNMHINQAFTGLAIGAGKKS